MKEIKIIDLLNMIAEGKEVPKRIKYNEIVYSYCDLDTSYNNEEYTRDLFSIYDIPSILNDTVEIIEEDNNKITPQDVENLGYACNTFRKCFETGWKKCEKDNNKIKEIYHCDMSTDNEEIKFLIDNLNFISDKINEIIDKINKE